MMKKVFIVAAFVLAAVPSMAQVQYTVSGIFAGNGKTVYLIDVMDDDASGDSLENRFLKIQETIEEAKEKLK